MSTESNNMDIERRKRINRLKKVIITVLLVLILVPIIFCIVLAFRLHSIENKLDEMNVQLEYLLQQLNLQEQKNDVTEIDESNVASEIPQAEIAINEDETVNESDLHEYSIYLTFDDGPSGVTEEILNILDEYDAKATFFVTGKEDEKSQNLMKEIVDRGHTLGMHSYSHKYSELYESLDSFKEDYFRLHDFIFETTGVDSKVYRFPGGSSNTVSKIEMTDCIEFLKEQGCEYYDWNVSSQDAVKNTLSVNTIVENCTHNIESKESAIILLHDSVDKKTTVEALPLIIEKINEKVDAGFYGISEKTIPVHHVE